MSDGAGDERDLRQIYLYCLVKDPHEHPFTLITRDIGDENSQVYPIHFFDLAFVASDCAQINVSATRANTLRHEAVVAEVMQRGFSLLPVRFGTVATATRARTAREGVERVLRRRFGEFQGLLQDMEDKAELGLKVSWKRERLFEDILREHREIRLLRDRIANRPSAGLGWRDERLRLGTMVDRAMEEKRNAEAAELTKALHPLAYDYKTNKTVTDMMVLNTAFLVRKAHMADFDAKIDELDHRYGERMRFSYVGPTPPYNFVEIVIHWAEEEDEEQFGREEVKGTWYRDRLPSEISSGLS